MFFGVERVLGSLIVYVSKHSLYKSFVMSRRLSSITGKKYPFLHESFEFTTLIFFVVGPVSVCSC